ncbi:MAG: SDR family oxidoreductase [Kiritimatiellae bacterium]|nr:SDR family oxidoreductase [Kiritimatiellia bacterium]
MKVLVTGGAGFLGSHLCERLVADGCEVVAFDNFYTGRAENVAHLEGKIDVVKGDVAEGLPEGKFDEIYSLACPASPVHYGARPIETMKTSVLGMLNILEKARRDGSRVLHASTSEVYGDPLVHPQVESDWGHVNPIGVRACYDEGKRAAETLAADFRRLYGVDVRMVRIFNTYGPRMQPDDGRVISNFIMQALQNKDITIYGDGSQTRSFQYAGDLIEAMRRYMALPKKRIDEFFAAKGLDAPVLNTGNPGEFTISELARETLRQIPTSRSRIVQKPLPKDDPKRRKPDISLAQELLAWQPRVPLAEGLAKTIAYFTLLASGKEI